MAEKPPVSLIDGDDPSQQLSRQPLHPTSTTQQSQSNPPFTPRSSTFPDDVNSDGEFDAFDPTPVHSPGGPDYDDLPPTYEEAQNEALQHARAGVPPLDPNNLEIRRLEINTDGTYPHPPPNPSGQQSRSQSSLVQDPNAYEFQPANVRNANGLGTTIPVTEVHSTEQVPVYQMGRPTQDTNAMLLNRALEFTQHEPDADARFAPRLTRKIAIPQITSSMNNIETAPSCGRRGGRGGRGRGGRGGRDGLSEDRHLDIHEPVQFLRAYAKALHSHSIRPAEFADFLDGLNVLCLATNTTPSDLSPPTTGPEHAAAELVKNYISASNEAFFAPRGLRVSLNSVSGLLSTVQIPEERGQRAGAIASLLDTKATAEQKALCLHPWIERLETDLAGSSARSVTMREMAERIRRRAGPQNDVERGRNEKNREAGHSNTEPASTDFPYGHGIPPWAVRGGFRPGFHGSRGWGSRGGRHEHGRGGRHSQDEHHGHSWGGREGRGGPRGFGPGHPLESPSSPFDQQRGGQNSWAAWGQALGKHFQTMGEEIGKRAEEWGEDFGKRAEEWGEDFGKRANTWGQDVGRRASGFGAGVERNAPEFGSRGTGEPSGANGSASASTSRHDVHELDGQESGIDRGVASPATGALEKEARHPDSKDKHHEKHDLEDEYDSDSSSSSSSSSDSDDEDELEEIQSTFLSRVREINLKAEAASSKGKKSPDEIARERENAIAKAVRERENARGKWERKRQAGQRKREMRARQREVKREHKQLKREMKREFGKGGTEGRRERREWKAKRRELKGQKREAKRAIKREWLEARRGRLGVVPVADLGDVEMVWVVVSNLTE